jgi:hypothetical protein
MSKPQKMVNGVVMDMTDEEIAEREEQQARWDSDFTSVRNERDSKLFRSDWTRLDDNGLSDEKKAEWATYRQALRDYPASASKVSKLGAWPSEPS